VIHQGAARDVASVHFGLSITITDIMLHYDYVLVCYSFFRFFSHWLCI